MAETRDIMQKLIEVSGIQDKYEMGPEGFPVLKSNLIHCEHPWLMAAGTRDDYFFRKPRTRQDIFWINYPSYASGKVLLDSIGKCVVPVSEHNYNLIVHRDTLVDLDTVADVLNSCAVGKDLLAAYSTLVRSSTFELLCLSKLDTAECYGDLAQHRNVLQPAMVVSSKFKEFINTPIPKVPDILKRLTL